ncbi:MAG: alpha/beta hydrolase-fold protein [Byssovorax sp.]
MGRPATLVRLILSWLAAGTLGCAAQPMPGPPPAETSQPQAGVSAAPSATAAQICAPGAGRCVDAGHVERCDPGGARRATEACGAASTCLDDRCVPLDLPARALLADRPFDRDALLALSPEGFLDAWAQRAPIPAARLDALVAAIEGADPPADADPAGPPNALCAPSGYVVPQRGGKSQGIQAALLSGVLVAARPGPVELWAGVSGKLRIYLNGKLALKASGEADPPPRPDEIVATAELHEGPNALLVALERPAQGTPGFFLRARGPGHARRDDLLFAPGPTDEPACGAADLVATRLAPTAVEKGYAVEMSATFHGLVPRAPGPLAYTVDLGEGAAARRVTTGSLDLLAAARGTVTASLAVPLTSTTATKLRVSFEGAPERAARDLPLTYRGDLHERIVALRAGVASLAFGAAPAGDRESLLGEVEMLSAALAAQDADVTYLKQRAAEAEDIAAGFAAGKNPYETRRGVLYRAYRSRLDGQMQPYLALVPRSLKKGKRYPLILGMHGLNGLPGQALRTVVGEAPDRANMNVLSEARHLPGLPDHGAIVVAPWAYGNAGQRLPGEDDVLRVIEEMKASYPVDPDRISITGYSLGGTVSFVVPLHYPDVFSAAAPLCGYPNFAQWSEVRTVPHTPWEDLLIPKRSIVRYAENGLHLPLHIVHGGKDGPERSAVIADRYRDLGYSRVFDVQDDLDHDVWEYAYEKGRMLDWLRAQKRPRLPKRVRLSTGEARYDRAYWVRLLSARDPDRFASIDAEVGGVVKVKTGNVEAFSLDLSGFDVKGLEVDGTALPACGGKGTSHVTIDDGGVHCSTEAPSLAGKKHAGVSGPLDDIQRHAALVVYGTGDPTSAEVNKLVAEHLRTLDRMAVTYPIKADVDVTDEELGRTSLILVGGPASNRVTKLFDDALPVRFDDKGLTLRGKRHEGESVGVSLIVPNPRNAEEYLVLHAGVGPRGTLAARHLPALAPDYLVYDERITSARSGQLLLGSRAVLDGGFFDKTWR